MTEFLNELLGVPFHVFSLPDWPMSPSRIQGKRLLLRGRLHQLELRPRLFHLLALSVGADILSFLFTRAMVTMFHLSLSAQNQHCPQSALNIQLYAT